MTEDEIERRIEAHVERLFNALDRRLLRGELTQAEYDRQEPGLPIGRTSNIAHGPAAHRAARP